MKGAFEAGGADFGLGRAETRRRQAQSGLGWARRNQGKSRYSM